ncbi:hypothetical protein SCALM49S_02823 [Streptomyces californicus]
MDGTTGTVTGTDTETDGGTGAGAESEARRTLHRVFAFAWDEEPTEHE